MTYLIGVKISLLLDLQDPGVFGVKGQHGDALLLRRGTVHHLHLLLKQMGREGVLLQLPQDLVGELGERERGRVRGRVYG